MNTDPVGRRQALEDLGIWDPDIEREWGYADEDIAGEDDAYDALLSRYSGRSERRTGVGYALLSLAVGCETRERMAACRTTPAVGL